MKLNKNKLKQENKLGSAVKASDIAIQELKEVKKENEKLKEQLKSNDSSDEIAKIEEENKQLKEKLKEGLFDIDKEIPEDLNDIENDIRKLMSNVISSGYQIGLRLVKIRNKELYKEKEERFEDYCIKTFGIHRTNIYRYIFLAENFDNVVAQQHGSKLELLQSVYNFSEKENKPEIKKEAYDYMMNNKPSYRQLLSYIKELKSKYIVGKPIEKQQEVIRGVSYKDDLYRIKLNHIDAEKKEEFKKEFEGFLFELFKKYS